MDLSKLSDLPEWVLMVAVGGYLAQAVANIGILPQDRPKENLVYQVMVYGFIGYFLGDLLQRTIGFSLGPLQQILSILIAVACAVVWRRWGRSLVFTSLRQLKMTNEDGATTVWNRLTETSNITNNLAFSQIIILLNNDTTLCCDDVAKFANAPVPLFSYDAYGNMDFYVTHYMVKEDKEYKTNPTLENDWGIMLTYIPVASIRMIEFRLTAAAIS